MTASEVFFMLAYFFDALYYLNLSGLLDGFYSLIAIALVILLIKKIFERGSVL